MTPSRSRVDASTQAARMCYSDALRNEDGAFDLPSILVGVVVVGILTAGVLAAIFGVIPFSQDKAAAQNISSIATAEGVGKAQNGTYDTVADLVSKKLLPSGIDPLKADAKQTASGGWAAAAKSDSGKVFLATDVNPTPTDVTSAPTPGGTLTAPTATVGTETINGSLAAGTYYYVFTASTIDNGETTKSDEYSITTTGTTSRNVILTTFADNGANGYYVTMYRGTTPGSETLLANFYVGQASDANFGDDGSFPDSTITPPTTNTAIWTNPGLTDVASALATK